MALYPPSESLHFPCAKLDNTDKSLPRIVAAGGAQTQLLGCPLIGYTPALPGGTITGNVPVHSRASAEFLGHALSPAPGIHLGRQASLRALELRCAQTAADSPTWPFQFQLAKIT